MCRQYSGLTLSFLWKCLGLALSQRLEQRGCWESFRRKVGSTGMPSSQEALWQIAISKPMQNLDQSKKNRWRVQWSQRQHLQQTRPHTTEMWKFGGTASTMCRTCGSNSNVKFLDVKAKPIWLHCFCSCFFYLASVVLALCKIRLEVWHLGDSK